MLGSAGRPLTGKPQWSTDQHCSAAARTGLGPSEVTSPLFSTSHLFLWFRPLIFKQQNSVLLSLPPCLKLPPSYGNTQRSGCFELFFPGSLAALLLFSIWEHKTPLQKTEAKASATEELLDIITQNNTAESSTLLLCTSLLFGKCFYYREMEQYICISWSSAYAVPKRLLSWLKC